MKYMRIVLVCEVLIQMILTSLWLMIILDIPFVLSLIPRVIEGVFMVLVLHGVGLGIAKGIFSRQLMRD